MPDQFLPVEGVSRHSVDAWLALGASPSRDAQDTVLADMAQNPRRERFILRDRTGPVVGFAIEYGEVGATTWTPRTRLGLGRDEEMQLYGEAIRHIVSLAERSGSRYVECVLKAARTCESVWKKALEHHQFRMMGSKCEWVKEDDPIPHPRARVRVRAVSPHSPLVSALYHCSTDGSGDRTTVYESRFGTGLGTADLVLVAELDRCDAGLCACLHEPGAMEAWLKYIGTVPQLRRNGVAGSLLAEAFARLSHSGATQIGCLVDPCNKPSVALHRSLGFKRVGAYGDFFYRQLGQEL